MVVARYFYGAPINAPIGRKGSPPWENFDGLLLVSDFDDTLYDSHHRVPERNLKALDYFRRQGGRFTVATGRAHRTFSPHVHLVPIDVPVVLSNGSALYDFRQERMLVQTFLSSTAALL